MTSARTRVGPLASHRQPAPELDVDALLDDPRTGIIVCCGSGGVGKTTTSAALVLRAAERGRKVVVLTIDPALQEAAYKALAGRKGAVVAVDPSTGAILALVTSPSYDPNLLSSHDDASVTKAWKSLQPDVDPDEPDDPDPDEPEPDEPDPDEPEPDPPEPEPDPPEPDPEPDPVPPLPLPLDAVCWLPAVPLTPPHPDSSTVTVPAW